jgi:hypothetical protein
MRKKLALFMLSISYVYSIRSKIIMTRIGILSFPRYFNYGTHLQLYALQKTVSKYGYKPEIIDYDPYNDSGMKKSKPGSMTGVIRSTLSSCVLQLSRTLDALAGKLLLAFGSEFPADRKDLFQCFLNTELELGSRTYFSSKQLDENPPECTAFIVGSDQVWHPVSHYKDSAYYLAFTEPSKRIAYAPSIGLSKIPESSKDWMREQINGIPHLSIREDIGASLVSELTGREAQVVLDPAYLLNADEWERFGVKHSDATRPYLLCYILESDRYIRDKAVAIAEMYDLELVMLPVHKFDIENKDQRFRRFHDVGPKEFVGLINNAAFVCTDSFHGTSFSIIFNRPFYTFKRYDNPSEAANYSRLESILKITGLQDRVMDKHRNVGQHDLEVDFSYANGQIEKLRQDSLSFLHSSIDAAASDWQVEAEIEQQDAQVLATPDACMAD